MMNDTIKKMYALAKEVSMHSHSPYSHFPVGCCIRTKNGQFYVGCNVENAAFPSGQCAEASAIGNMVSQGAREIEEVVLYTNSRSPCWPCGNCRQKLSEFAKSDDVRIHSISAQHDTEITSLSTLLPKSFSAQIMEN